MGHKVASLWLAGVLGRQRRILNDKESMGIYGLPASPFSEGVYRGQPYQPAGLAADTLQHLHAFLARAEGFAAVDARAAFIEGKGVTLTGDAVGRTLYAVWFKAAKIHFKINDIWDIVLSDADMTPQNFIKDRAEALKDGEIPDFATKMPPCEPVKMALNADMVEAVFGKAAGGKRVADAAAQHCCSGMWTHQWKRYDKLRGNALKKCEAARILYEEKRDCE